MAAYCKNFVILACTVSIGLQSEPNGQTDGQTPCRHSAIARNKNVTLTND